MGMDLTGKKPKNETGEYLRYSVWSWHPLIDYVLAVSPEELTGKCKYWHSNDGDGLNAEDSRRLAGVLTGEIDSGRAKVYVEALTAEQAALPDIECYLCKGTGKRDDAHVKGECNACLGRGKVRPESTYYGFSLESVVRFRDFLVACGGFSIH
jgi:hypothetical protein